MRPNLSVEKIAGALAVLGTSVLMAACGGGDKPANAPVNSTETPTAGGDAKPADGHCGADKSHKEGEASCGAKPADKASEAAPADTAAAPAAASTAAPAAAPDTKAADAKPADAKADAKKPADTKKPAAAPAAGGKKGGGASCGAGTCSAKK